ncbi:MAG: hypothetical protein ACKVP5_09695 [Aestuariivirga sp.]
MGRCFNGGGAQNIPPSRASLDFIADLEHRTSRRLAPRKRGPKPGKAKPRTGGKHAKKSKVSR